MMKVMLGVDILDDAKEQHIYYDLLMNKVKLGVDTLDVAKEQHTYLAKLVNFYRLWKQRPVW